MIAAPAALAQPGTAPAPAGKTLAEFVGVRAPSTIQRTASSPTPKKQQIPSLTYLDSYEALGKTIPLTKAQAIRLATLLNDPGSFYSDGPAKCTFRPGISYRCGDGVDAVDLLVCFGCDEIAVVPFGKPIKATFHFPQSARDILLGLAKELLRNDDAIQALPAKRSEKTAPPPAAPVPGDVPRPGQPKNHP